MRSRSLAMFAPLIIGCLPAFAPNLRARATHAGLQQTTSGETCMGCHVSEHEASRHPGEQMPAPIVADWMLVESRTCVDCHRVTEPRTRSAVWLVERSRAQ